MPRAVNRAAIRNVIEADYDTKRTHPYGKPAKIFREIFPRACMPGDLILDPFAGSGVTRTVAKELGFRWEGCDIDPAYAETDSETPLTLSHPKGRLGLDQKDSASWPQRQPLRVS